MEIETDSLLQSILPSSHARENIKQFCLSKFCQVDIFRHDPGSSDVIGVASVTKSFRQISFHQTLDDELYSG